MFGAGIFSLSSTGERIGPIMQSQDLLHLTLIQYQEDIQVYFVSQMYDPPMEHYAQFNTIMQSFCFLSFPMVFERKKMVLEFMREIQREKMKNAKDVVHKIKEHPALKS